MKILLVDDHAIVRDGLRRLLSVVGPEEVIEAAGSHEALKIVRRNTVDLIVLDLNLPDLGGLELLQRLLRVSSAPILVLSMHAEHLYVRRALDAGARGYLTKNAAPDEVLVAARRVLGGGRYVESNLAQSLAFDSELLLEKLSDRDLEILRLLVQGHSLGEIAQSVGLSYKTVANLCTQLKSRLGATRNADLIRMAIDWGIS